jgi:hypothetical protein
MSCGSSALISSCHAAPVLQSLVVMRLQSGMSCGSSPACHAAPVRLSGSQLCGSQHCGTVSQHCGSQHCVSQHCGSQNCGSQNCGAASCHAAPVLGSVETEISFSDLREINFAKSFY